MKKTMNVVVNHEAKKRVIVRRKPKTLDEAGLTAEYVKERRAECRNRLEMVQYLLYDSGMYDDCLDNTHARWYEYNRIMDELEYLMEEEDILSGIQRLNLVKGVSDKWLRNIKTPLEEVLAPKPKKRRVTKKAISSSPKKVPEKKLVTDASGITGVQIAEEQTAYGIQLCFVW